MLQYCTEAWPLQRSNQTPLPPLASLSKKESSNYNFRLVLVTLVLTLVFHIDRCSRSGAREIFHPQGFFQMWPHACHCQPSSILIQGREAEGGLCKTKGGWRSQFHSTISPPDNRRQQWLSRLVPSPRGRLPSQSKLFKPFHAFSCQTKPFQERRNTPNLPLNCSKSAQ